MLIELEEARSVALRVLRGVGTPQSHADLQAEVLIEAELRGLASHGLLRLPLIVERVHNGVADPRATGRQRWRSDALLDVDGEGGLGPVVACEAIERICERARRLGMAVAAIRNSGHLGAIGWYAEKISRDGQIAIVLSTSEALVHPWGGRKALIGTNPIAIGVPVQPDPFVLDMATGVISMGKVHDYANRGQPLEPGWALDAEGNPTTDAAAARQGAIAPFGDAKGYGLALGFELLVASLTASALGTNVTGTLDSTLRATKGDVIIVMEPHAESGASLAAYLDEVRACPPIRGGETVAVPGDRSRSRRAENLTRGLEIPDAIWSKLRRLADCSSLES
ncbi:Ldh family oxidoreductase [Mesorhizobium caraganae]|uniref:Ldh family oxidoreductase n=1 Tax=Mesorhizobium caraganae TaxID=483206 RepID=UPI00177B7B3B|nr:Ldh family oxidoreductase [Mesorhizobium caraganae]